MNKKGTYNWTTADQWIIENSDLSYSAFKKEFPGFPFTDATFYNRKLKLKKKNKLSIETPTRSYSTRTLYQTLVSVPSSEIAEEELKGMKRMNEILEKHMKVKVEIIEIIKDDQRQIEIRQVQTR